MNHHRTRLRVAAAFVLLIALAVPAGPAQQTTPQPAAGAMKSGVTAVLVDVVVRDKRGQVVRDLQQSDFEVLEDGVPQAIGSFTRMFDGAVMATPDSGAPTAPAPAAAVGAPLPVGASPTVTALVFDRLNPEARRLAVLAAQDYFGSKDQARDYVGIFGIDLALTSYAPFTRNRETLRQAIEKIANRSSSSFGGTERREAAAAADERASAAEQAATRAGAGGGRGASQAIGSATAEAQFAEMQAKMIRDFEVMERDQQGYATTNGLLAIVATLRRLPGRKSIVFFSEGIAIPPAVLRLFRGVIDAANRANVSIYTMDAAGLRAESEQAKIRDQVNTAAKAGVERSYSDSGGSNRAPLTQRLEKNEDVLRQDPRTGLAELAQDTGGLVFDNTNNLRQGFDRIESDLHNYYLLGYSPANETYDGRFRTIDVRVKRPGMTVAARRGYFAVRDPGGVAVNPWEAPALAALERTPVPNAFPIRATTLLFPDRRRPGLAPVVADVATTALTFRPAADGSTYASDFTILVRFLDAQNQVVRQVSQHYELKGPLADRDRARQGDIIFYREPELPPGVYTMEAIVYDAPSGNASVRVSTLEVAKADPSRLRMSALMLVKRSEKVAARERRDDNPLLVNDVVLYPNLGEPVSKAAKELAFYFVIYPGDEQPPPACEIQLLQNGQLLAELPMPLAPREPSGRVPQLGRLPLDQLAPGTYELRATAKQGDQQVSRTAILRIVD